MRNRSKGLGAAATALATLLGACQPASVPRTADEARILLRSAIEAHGGRDRLARFDDFRIVSSGVFKDQAAFRRTVDYRGADHWSMSADFPGGGVLRVGIDGARCWKQDRHRVEVCSEEERRQNVWMAVEHNAWVLPRIDETTVQPAGSVRIGLHAFPAIRAGEMVLVFDPQSHRLVQVRHAERIDALADFRVVDGALIAARRVVTIGGQPDLEETWTDILPGGSDASALRAPEFPAEGVVFDGTDAARAVAWMEVDDPVVDTKAAVQQLDAFIRRCGRNPSSSEGVIWTAPDRDDPAGRWRVAVGIEGGTPLAPVEARGLHLEAWPAMRVLGVFHRGDFRTAEAQRTVLHRLMQERSRAPAPGARLQILASREVFGEAPATWMSFVRLAVQ